MSMTQKNTSFSIVPLYGADLPEPALIPFGDEEPKQDMPVSLWQRLATWFVRQNVGDHPVREKEIDVENNQTENSVASLGSPVSGGEDTTMEDVQRRDIGHGIHVTKSGDGVFIHFRLPSGQRSATGSKGTGFRVDEPNGMLGQQTLHSWALAILGHQVFDS